MTNDNEWWMDELRKSTGGLRYKFQTITDVDIEKLLRNTAEESSRRTLESVRGMVEGMKRAPYDDYLKSEKRCVDADDWNAALDAVIEGLEKI